MNVMNLQIKNLEVPFLSLRYSPVDEKLIESTLTTQQAPKLRNSSDDSEVFEVNAENNVSNKTSDDSEERFIIRSKKKPRMIETSSTESEQSQLEEDSSDKSEDEESTDSDGRKN